MSRFICVCRNQIKYSFTLADFKNFLLEESMFFLSKNSTRRFFSSSSASELNILPFSLPTQLNNMFLSLNKKILISLSSYFLGNLLQIISKILNFSCGSSTIDDNSNCFNLSKLRFLANFNTILFFRSMLSIFSISKF